MLSRLRFAPRLGLIVLAACVFMAGRYSASIQASTSSLVGRLQPVSEQTVSEQPRFPKKPGKQSAPKQNAKNGRVRTTSIAPAVSRERFAPEEAPALTALHQEEILRETATTPAASHQAADAASSIPSGRAKLPGRAVKPERGVGLPEAIFVPKKSRAAPQPDDTIYCALANKQNGAKLRCAVSGVSLVGAAARSPGFLVTGPATSGSMVLSELLAQHPSIRLEQAVVSGKHVLQEESCLSQGAAVYAPYFQKVAVGVKALGGMAPQSARDTRIPHRARLVLGRDLQLLYTWRDSLELDVSLYLSGSRTVKSKTYASWARTRLREHEEWSTCRESAFNDFFQFKPIYYNASVSLSDLNNSSFFSSQMAGIIEDKLGRICGNTLQSENPLYEILHAPNLLRWAQVLRPGQILCVHLEDLTADTLDVEDKLAEFLHIDRSGFPDGEIKTLQLTGLKLDQTARFGAKAGEESQRALAEVKQMLEHATSTQDRARFAKLCPRTSSKPELAKSSEAYPSSLDPAVFCVSHPGGLRCAADEDRRSVSAPRWPTFLGIGPAKSGSTALFKMLRKHPRVRIGNSHLGGRHCCDAELYVLTENDVLDVGAAAYSPFFPQDLSGATQLGEKTPHYACHPMVPYRARLLLGQDLKLVYTWRDSLELDMSLYLYRAKQKGGFQPYAEWAGKRLKNYVGWRTCREAAFKAILMPSPSSKTPPPLKLDDLYTESSFTAETAGLIEAELMEQCPKHNLGDVFQEMLHTINLRRWVHVFGRKQILCVHVEDQMEKTLEMKTQLAKFLNIDVGGLPAPLKKDAIKGESIRKPGEVLERLEQDQLTRYGKEGLASARRTVDEVRSMIEASTRGKHWAWFQKLCPRL